MDRPRRKPGMTPAASKKVAIYARRSKKTEGSDSIPVQVKDCLDRAEDEGWEIVVEPYIDDGVSAWNPKKKRPAFERLLVDIEEGRVNTVLVRETERLVRQWAVDAPRIDQLAGENGSGKLKVLASTMEGDIVFARARDRSDFRDRVSKAQFYSDYLSEKIRRTFAQKKERGEWLGGGHRPYGYNLIAVAGEPHRRIEINRDEARVFRQIARQIIDGKSINAITLTLNERGIPTSGGSHWRPAHVKRLFIADVRDGNGNKIGEETRKLPVEFKPILEPDQEQLVTSILKRRKAKPGRPSDARSYVLNGLVVCDACGKKMVGSREVRKDRNGRVYEQYVCSVNRGGGCSQTRIGALPLERWFVDALADENERRGRGWVVTRTTSPASNKKVNAELKKLDEQEAELSAEENDYPPAYVKRAYGKIVAAREELLGQLRETTQETVTDTITINGEEWPIAKLAITAAIHSWFERTLPNPARMELHDGFAEFIQEIRVRPKADRIETPEDRVTITWK
jgi:DNA invertase Pin-like site-specific DNA recombinase